MNYPYYYNRPNMPVTEQAQLKGRPVSSIEEVRATTIDFDGSVFYFPDLANKRIYTKQINMDGTNTVNMYELKPIPVPQAINPSQYITREEFEAAFMNLQKEIAGATINSASQQTQSAPQTNTPAPQEQVKTPVQSTPPQNFNF